jgi:hypothetical protein
MGLPADQIRVIARGAFVHDIGKIAIPDMILFNPSALTSNEMGVMRQHCAKGYEIIKKLPFLAEAAEIVYCHHESYEGSGYPRGLKGEQIPIGARIVAVANTLDAITSNLPYRPAQSLEVAKTEIEGGAGSQFDPRDRKHVFVNARKHMVGLSEGNRAGETREPGVSFPSMLPISHTDRVFILTGAGVSAESGIPTFCGVNGLWRNHRIEEVASPHAWARDPRLVWEFYSMRRRVAAEAKPNPAHLSLAKLEQTLGERLFLCTQNVDNLHEPTVATKRATKSLRELRKMRQRWKIGGPTRI